MMILPANNRTREIEEADSTATLGDTLDRIRRQMLRDTESFLGRRLDRRGIGAATRRSLERMREVSPC